MDFPKPQTQRSAACNRGVTNHLASGDNAGFAALQKLKLRTRFGPEADTLNAKTALLRWY
jgi:hypothetical protein